MTQLTAAQRRVFEFIQDQLSCGACAPSVREISTGVGYRSKRASELHVKALVEAGYLTAQKGKARTLRLGPKGQPQRAETADIPLFGTIPAGFGSDREQEPDSFVTVDVATIGFKPTRNSFALEVRGDSMIGRHICHGDLVLLEHGPEPRHGQIVAALVDRKSTLKTFLLKNGKPYLRAENPKYPDVIPCEELVIQGVFKALIRKAKE